MNDRETKAANAFKQRSLGRILIDFLETRRSGMSDSICMNRRGVQFWVEFKALEAWPKRTSTCPMARCFEPGQIPFLRERICWGGRGFVLAKIGTDWLLLNPMLDLFDLNSRDLVEVASYAEGLDNIVQFLADLENK